MKLRLVQWEDACSVDEWKSIDELAQGVTTCKAAGFVTRETETSITLSLAISSDDQACCSLVIPRSCILKISDLTLGAELNLSAT